MRTIAKQFLLATSFVLLLVSAAVAAKPYVLIDQQGLDALRQTVQAKQLNATQTKLVDALLQRAEQMLAKPNPSVMSKTLLPPTQDKHDYLSISRYWWPDPSKDNGLPWIRKDGQTNPDTQTDAVDRKNLGRMAVGTKSLALAYFFSGEAKYAQKAASMVRTWFLDSETRMNPHLLYAQSVPGNDKPRRSGILDGRLIPEHVLDAITLISDSGFWGKQDQQAMEVWLKEYLAWLTDSKVGKQGAKQTNNHGSWYKFQVAALSYYLGDDKRLQDVVAATKQSLATQFGETGVQAHEVKRTRSYFYSAFNLRAMLSVALVADKAGLSFWDYQTENGRSLALGIDYLTPVAEGKKWPHPAKAVKLEDLAVVLTEIAQFYPDKNYARLAKQILTHGSNDMSKLEFTDVKSPMMRRPELLLHVE